MWVGHRDTYNEIVMKDPSLLYKEAGDIASLPGGLTKDFRIHQSRCLQNFKDMSAERTVKAVAHPGFPRLKPGCGSREYVRP